ncbi:MAG: Deoxyribose-phosphate aldolase 1 [Cryomorphaceae bacterium]|nr:MAG: Deoxyribose-phosphate aldolase 1 [Cryomorphaceae bacterium]
MIFYLDLALLNMTLKKKVNIASYLDSTYLKTAAESGISQIETKEIVVNSINKAIEVNFACIMIRSEFIAIAKELIETSKSKLKVGTVVDFPFGTSSTKQKISMGKLAIESGAYDIDYVCDYNAFKRGSFEKFDNDIIEVTKLVLGHKKIIKWIIETGALSKDEIRSISKRISKLVQSNFPQNSNKVFIKTSTGYYGGYGATVEDVKIIKSVSGILQIKASGGMLSLKDCMSMIKAGASRIGTSNAELIYKEKLENEF